MASSVSADSRLGDEIAGYRIERLLGQGGMSVVYLAHHDRLDRNVALKLLTPDLAEDVRFRERFLRESRLAASLDHPNVIPIYDADDEEGVLFIAMRYVEGTDLGRLLRAEQPVSAVGLLSILDRVASALDAAHERGLVHRDVKPENVLLADAGSDEHQHVYLADFGLSSRLGDEQEADDAAGVLGSLDYLAPEQIHDRPVSAQTDVYALGCVLFRALTGEAPFAGAGRLAVLWGHLEKPPPAASERDPDLPVALDPVLARAMAKEPEQRHESCGALIEETRTALGLPAERPSEELPSRRRRRARLLVVAALLVAIAAAALVPALLLTNGDDKPQVGDKWTRAPHNESVFGGALETQAGSIAAGPSGLVAVGSDGRWPEHTDIVVWTSPDGVAWTRVSDPDLLDERSTFGWAVAAGPSGFVAVGTWTPGPGMSPFNPAVWRSPDGKSWERVGGNEEAFGAPGGGAMAAVAARGAGYVAVGQDGVGGVVWTSPDGASWSRLPSDPTVFGPRTALNSSVFMWALSAADDGRIVAVGRDWEYFENDRTPSGPGSGIGGVPLGVGAAWFSSDGVRWSRAEPDDVLFGDESTAFTLNDVTAGGRGFVAVGSDFVFGEEAPPDFALGETGPRALTAVVLTTVDGLVWSRVPSDQLPGGGESVHLEAITVTESGLVAVGWRREQLGVLDGNVDPVVWTSLDGTSWSEAADPDMVLSQPGGQLMADVAAGGPGLVAIGHDGDSRFSNTAVWTSP